MSDNVTSTQNSLFIFCLFPFPISSLVSLSELSSLYISIIILFIYRTAVAGYEVTKNKSSKLGGIARSTWGRAERGDAPMANAAVATTP